MRTMRRCGGFTLAEVLIATVLVAIALGGTTWAMASAARTKAELEELPYTATLLAKEVYELAEGLPREPSGEVGVTSGGDVAALDSLVGASFSPPIRADGTADDSLAGWTQNVTLQVYALDDLTTPTADDPTWGVDAFDAKLYRLSVTILEDGETVDTFRWWLTP